MSGRIRIVIQRLGDHRLMGQRSWPWLPACIAAAAGVFATAGCRPPGSEPTVPAAGRLVYKGLPVAQVELLFMPVAGRPGYATTDAQGRFAVTTFRPEDGAVPGRHRVTLRAIGEAHAFRFDDGPPRRTASSVQLPFPTKYASSIDTDLEVDLGERGSRDLELVLSDP